MNAKRILIAALILAAAGLAFNQWRLQRAVGRLSAATPAGSPADNSAMENAESRLRQAEARLNEAKTQLEIADAKLANANAQLAQLERRVQQLEGGRLRPGAPSGRFPTAGEMDVMTRPADGPKRSWGEEQATGEPDTLQAGDIPTAWAPLEQDGGEEWLKLEYERAVDIAEVRVRETHNPGAVSKVTAFLANGTEVTLWEGTEPPVTAPVEMSFQVPSSGMAKSVKVYLDTKRVPGWNEIDAVELIGRDGSHQWAKHASASSSYAQPRSANRLSELESTQRF